MIVILQKLKQSAILPVALSLLLVLGGCLEQIQSTRTPTGALNNFLLHLQAGELDDARAYFAPGLVTQSPDLDQLVIAASGRARRYEIVQKPARTEDEQVKLTVPLDNGKIQETIKGRVRLRPVAGAPTPGPDVGWQEVEIITARMVSRGPGWRILDFELKCCP